jgi:benzodiazapine receptor
MKIQYLKLLASIIICQAAGVIGSIFTASSIPTWYAQLRKPTFNPPNWIFGPVWILLFLLMGISLYLLWSEGLQADGVKEALIVFSVQLILNIIWSILFFGLKNPFLAFIEIIALWLTILLTMLLSYKVSPAASYLFIPYMLWVSFAAVLNLYIFRLNP